jgi:molybdopterin-containing oxidoreductase family iron-sulfur binding subunit
MSQGTEDNTQRGAADGDCHVEWKKTPAPGAALDLATVRERLRESKGPQFWRSLEELAATPQFEDMLQREFPRHAAEWPAESDDPDAQRLLAA